MDDRVSWKVINFTLVLAVVAIILLSPFKFHTVIGSSMEPTISQNDVVVVVSMSNLKVGDVITYWHEIEGKRYIFMHRIIEIQGDFIKTKGDALKKPDNYVVKKSDVVGKVVFIIPVLGALIHFTTSIAGWISFILIPSLLLITIEAEKIIKVIRNG